MQERCEMQVRSLGQEVPLEEGITIHCSILAWRIPWTEERGGIQSMGLQRVENSWVTNSFRVVVFFFFFRASVLGVVSGEVGRVEHGVRFLIWSTAEWVVVPFPEIQAIRTGEEYYFLLWRSSTSCMLFLVLSKCLMLTILLNSHLGSRRWSCLLIPILLMRKLRHGEVSSLPQNTGPESSRVRIQSRQWGPNPGS